MKYKIQNNEQQLALSLNFAIEFQCKQTLDVL